LSYVNSTAGFIGYGGASGARAVENLRLIMGELQVATVRAQVGLSMFPDFENFSVFKPAPNQEKHIHVMLDQVIAWASALKTLREKQESAG
jgi:NAD(P)H-dependent FMN reductase